MNSGIFYSDLSDHLPIFQVTHPKLDAETPCRKRSARLINSATTATFKSKLETTDWSVIYKFDSTNDSYHIFSSLLINHFNLKLHNLNLGALLNPGFQKVSLYLVTGIILFINNSKKNPTKSNKARYNKYRNKYNFLFIFARKKYSHDKVVS